MDINITNSPNKADFKGNNKIHIKQSKLEKLKAKYEKVKNREAIIPSIAGVTTVGIVSTTPYGIPIAILGGAIILSAGILISKTHQLILKRRIEKVEESIKRR